MSVYTTCTDNRRAQNFAAWSAHFGGMYSHDVRAHRGYYIEEVLTSAWRELLNTNAQTDYGKIAAVEAGNIIRELISEGFALSEILDVAELIGANR